MDLNEIIRTLANMSDFDQQSVFFALSRFPSIHQPILDKASSELANTFQLQASLPRTEGVLEGVSTPRRSRRLQRGSPKKQVVVESSEEDKSKSDADFQVDASEESSSSSTEDTSQPNKKVHFIFFAIFLCYFLSLLVTLLFCLYCRS